MQRYDFDHWMQSMVEENEGDYVLYTDHLAEIERLQARIRELEGALEKIIDEIGVPQPGYIRPAANAYEIAKQALKGD